METNIQIFENEQFGQIRIVNTENEPMFAAVDVCKALGYANGKDAVMSHIDESDRRVFQRSEIATLENVPNRGLTFINESGLYALIFGSKLESAKEFKHWVTSEVLPSIRKHGAYMTDEIIERTLTDPDYLIRLATELKNEKQKRLAAEHTVEKQTKQLAEQKPKVEFYDAVTESDGSETFEVVAKSIKNEVLGVPRFGRNTLTKILREMKIIFGTGRQIRPYQKYIDLKYFELVNYPYIKNRRAYMGWQTLVTQLGKQFIVKTLKRYFYDKEQQIQGKQLVLFSNNQ